MTTSTAIETPIDLNVEGDLLGNLFVTDARLLIRPAVAGQYHRYATHDSNRANWLLGLGDDMNCYTTHIVSHDDAGATYALLDDVFRVYIDACCMELWCDAVVYFMVDHQIARTERYGFDDGEYTMHIYVYCNVPQDDAEAVLATVEDDMIVLRPDSSEFGCVASMRNI